MPIDYAAFRSTANTNRNKHFFCNPERHALALKSQLLPLTKSSLQRGLSLGALASCHSQKSIQDRWTGNSKMPLGVNASMSGLVYDSFVMNWLSGSASVWLTNGYQGFSFGSVRSNYNPSEKAEKEVHVNEGEDASLTHNVILTYPPWCFLKVMGLTNSIQSLILNVIQNTILTRVVIIPEPPAAGIRK